MHNVIELDTISNGITIFNLLGFDLYVYNNINMSVQFSTTTKNTFRENMNEYKKGFFFNFKMAYILIWSWVIYLCLT